MPYVHFKVLFFFNAAIQNIYTPAATLLPQALQKFFAFKPAQTRAALFLFRIFSANGNGAGVCFLKTPAPFIKHGRPRGRPFLFS